MQEPALVLLALAFGHLLGDFLFQTERDVYAKAALEWRGFARHAAVHYVATVGSLAVLVGASPLSARTHLAVAALVAIHTLIDVGKSLFSRRFPTSYQLTAFLVDQAAHVVTLLFVGWGLLLGRPPLAPTRWFVAPLSVPTLAVLVTYVAVVVAGGQLVRIALIPFARGLEDGRPDDQLAYAGLYIGRLERFLVLTAILVGSYASVGLIVAAKSIFRFPDLRDRPFAEYFLIGTLLSVTLAVVGAMCLRALL